MTLTPPPALRIALYQPDIPQNLGAMMRLCACLGVELDIIEPCGFPLDDRKIQRAGMDYMTLVKMQRHRAWQDFRDGIKGRIVLTTTRADQNYLDFRFAPGDILLVGRESAGVPEDVHRQADARICIAMAAGARSLNIVNATAMIAGEALRQITREAFYEAKNER